MVVNCDDKTQLTAWWFDESFSCSLLKSTESTNHVKEMLTCIIIGR